MKRRDPEGTRQAILEAAKQVFSERGFADTSTSSLARRAGVTKSLIHHHFGSKEGLWEAIKQREFGDYHADQKAKLELPFEPNLEVLLDSLRTYFDFLKSRPRFARMLTWMYLEHDESCRDMGADLFAKGVERLVEGQTMGTIRPDVAPESILMAMFALVDYWFLAGKSHTEGKAGPAQTEAQYLDDIVKILANGVQGPECENSVMPSRAVNPAAADAVPESNDPNA